MDTSESVVVEPVGPENWRAVANVAARRGQELFVMPVAWYLALCQYEGLGWKPYAIRQGDTYVGFVMAAVDEEENSYWVGGFVIDAAHQRLGYGRRAMQVLLKWGRDGLRDGSAQLRTGQRCRESSLRRARVRGNRRDLRRRGRGSPAAPEVSGPRQRISGWVTVRLVCTRP